MVDRSFKAILPLTRKIRLDPGELLTELRLFVEQSGASVRMDPRMMAQANERPQGLRGLFSSQPAEQRILFEVDGVRLRVHSVAEPFEQRSRIHRFVNPAHWTRGLGEFADHRAHIVIQEAGIEGEEGPDAVFDRAAAVTATAAVVARLTRPVGVVWSAAENAVPVTLFREGMDELTEGLAPLRVWVRWHMIPPDEMQDAYPGLVTHGLAPFVGREILARPSLVEAHRLIEIVLAFARMLVDDRASVSERDSKDLDDGTQIDIRLRGPGKLSDVPVYEITVPGMEAPPPRERAPDPLAMPSMPDSGESEDRKRGRLAAMLGLRRDDDDGDGRPLPYIPPPPGLAGAAGQGELQDPLGQGAPHAPGAAHHLQGRADAAPGAAGDPLAGAGQAPADGTGPGHGAAGPGGPDAARPHAAPPPGQPASRTGPPHDLAGGGDGSSSWQAPGEGGDPVRNPAMPAQEGVVGASHGAGDRHARDRSAAAAGQTAPPGASGPDGSGPAHRTESAAGGPDGSECGFVPPAPPLSLDAWAVPAREDAAPAGPGASEAARSPGTGGATGPGGIPPAPDATAAGAPAEAASDAGHPDPQGGGAPGGAAPAVEEPGAGADDAADQADRVALAGGPENNDVPPPRITADGQAAPEPHRSETGVRDYAVAGGRRIRVITGGKVGS